MWIGKEENLECQQHVLHISNNLTLPYAKQKINKLMKKFP
jgi:hypothetical protein